MPVNRFFIQAPLTQDTSVSLEGSEHHHLSHVLRLQEEDTLELVNGKGSLATASIISSTKHSTSLLISSVKTEPAPSQKLTLAQALLKMAKLELIIEKGTELGLTDFWFFPGDKSEKEELSITQIERLRAITVSALKQSGRLHLPSFELKPPLEKWQKTAGKFYFGDMRSYAPFFSKLYEPDTLPLIFFVGPEKGLSADETAILESKFGATGVRLAANTLRAETAALTASALMQHISQ